MRILFIGIGHPPPTFINRRLEALRKTGIKVLVNTEANCLFSARQAQKGLVPVYKLSSLPSILVVLFSVLLNPVRLYHIFRLFKHIPAVLTLKSRFLLAVKYHRLSAVKVDLVHFQWVAHVADFSWLPKVLHAPVVASARGSMVTVYPATIPGYNYKEKLIKSFAHSDFIHCVSHDIADKCEQLGASKEKIFVNYNGIDVKKFSPAGRRANTHLHTVTTGALMWRKGVLWQLIILARLKAQGLKVYHTVIGDGPEMAGLRYQAIRLGIADRVTFTGRIAEDEVIAHLRKADLYLSTSSAEGLANSVLKAAACGLPAIVFDCEGMHEIVKHDHTGYIVKYGDLTEFAAKFSELASDKKKRQRFGQAARKLVEEKFRIEEQVKEMVAIYKKIASRV